MSSQTPVARNRVLGYGALLLGLMVALALNYHSFLADFNLVPGDRGDTRLVVFALEHWFQVFQGHEAFFRLNMFFPDPRALGYADGLFLFSPPYGLFRLAGLDYFSSYQLLFVFMTALGYIAWSLLLHRALRLGVGFAILGAVLLTSLNSIQYQAQTGQMLGYHFYPILIGALFVYASEEHKAGIRGWFGLGVFTVGLGLLFFTSYYPAWFFLFTLLLYAAVVLAASALRRGARATVLALGGFLRANGGQLAVAVFLFVVSLIPFGINYAPLVLSDSHRSYALVEQFAPSLRDLINISAQNYVWSPLFRLANFKFGGMEVQLGSPLFVLALFAAQYVQQIGARLRRRPAAGQRADLVFLLSTTALLILALIVKFRGFSAWYVVYSLVPGASALRALGRFLTIIDMVIVVAAVYAMNGWYRSLMARRPRARPFVLAATALAAIVLVAEQANGAPFRLDKAGQLSFMRSYQLPGIPCRAFFINNVPTDDLPVGYYQLDAMMISMQLGIPTVNGYSGFTPDEVFSLPPAGIEYKYRVLNWLRSKGIEHGICELDIQSRTFQGVDVAADFARYRQLNRDAYLQTFSALFSAVRRYLTDGNSVSDLTPQRLEQGGYLDPSFGYEVGPAYKWMQDRYWIGERSCGKSPCFGIGMVGSYDALRGIIDEYGGQALQIFFPEPAPWVPDGNTPDEETGELLIVFPAETFAP